MEKKKHGFMSMLHRGSHYKMERFAVMFSVLVVCIGVVGGLCFHRDFRNQDNSIQTKAKYNEEFTTSKTDIKGKVIDVYASKDKTKAFVLFQFEDVSEVSTDANQYRSFLTAASVRGNSHTIDGKPAGSIYVFGNSGYMGVYLVNDEGFKPQVLQLTVRSLKELKTNDAQPSQSQSEQAKTDPSFAENDQFDIYANPGADDATNIACLNSNQAPTVTELFNQTVGKTMEKELKEKLVEDLKEMKASLTKVNEYSARLTQQDGVQLPEPPELVAGDSIKVDNNGTKDNQKDDKFITKFGKIAAGGYDFDWQNGHVGDGWLDKLIAKTGSPNMTPEQYFSMQVKARSGDDVNSAGNLTDIQWMMKDGTPLEDLNTGNSDTGRYTDINKDCQNLVNAWQDYIRAKVQYQTTDLEKLLALDAASGVVSDTASINTDDKAVMVY